VKGLSLIYFFIILLSKLDSPCGLFFNVFQQNIRYHFLSLCSIL